MKDTDPLQRSKLSRFSINRQLIMHLLLIVVLLAGAYLRLIGVNWDANHHLHPDERFLSMVQAAIQPAAPGTYFDTAVSRLNPANNGYTFFVYGTWPIFIIRYLGELTAHVGYDTITIFGRILSALADLFTVFLVYLIGSKAYKPKVGLLGATFYAFAVLPIQLSHFMTVDTFTNTFGMLTVYAAVILLKRKPVSYPSHKYEEIEKIPGVKFSLKEIWVDIFPYLLFGIALGMATASKINAVSLALLLPLVELVGFLKLIPQQREKILGNLILKMVFAAVVSFITFRICQPYAFNGPTFFNFGINSDWWSAMRSLQAQAAGDVDYPPALQWARRPITFSLSNFLKWGLGLPLGITAVLSFLVMAWQIIKKKQFQHFPVWGWTAFYFVWQASAWVRSMRYQMLVYPLFALIAAWALITLWENNHEIRIRKFRLESKYIRVISIILLTCVLLGTAAWGFSFTRIYTRDHTRVAASKWIYNNIPGPLNLLMETEEGQKLIPMPYRSGDTLVAGVTYRIPFTAQTDSLVTSIRLPQVQDQLGNVLDAEMRIAIIDKELNSELESSIQKQDPQNSNSLWQGHELEFSFSFAPQLRKGKTYFVEILLKGQGAEVFLKGVPQLILLKIDGTTDIQSLRQFTQTIRKDKPYLMDVGLSQNGLITGVYIPRLVDLNLNSAAKTLALTLTLTNGEGLFSSNASLTDSFDTLAIGQGDEYYFELDRPIKIESSGSVNINLSLLSGEASLSISALAPVHESSWDDALPLSLNNFYPYSDGGGIFRGDLNLELYWPDDESKRSRYESALDQADYIFISSNRQWGTTTRVPERYPLTSFYYRALLGCPADIDLVTCYNIAQPGDYKGQLGFELVETFESYPNLGVYSFNDQFAEEAFTVYDHPKVLIFKKSEAYDPNIVRDILRSVDLTKVINITAKQASDYDSKDQNSPQKTLLLSADDLARQQAGGTWSEIFDRESAVNTSQVLAVIAIYLFSWLLGILVFPFLSLALPGLKDKGYPFMRIAGLLLLAYMVWLAGSVGISYSKTTILAALGILLLLSVVFIIFQRKVLLLELKNNWRYLLLVEGIALLSFLFFLVVRIGNPDLWHPWKGGEKPMDFSYLNAIIKSTTFPPYDPWFSGGYINYYYFGQMVISVPIILLGVIPATAYNIILPLLYSMVCLGAFSLGWNIYLTVASHRTINIQNNNKQILRRAFIAGILVILLLALLGNLGTVRLIVNTFQSLGASGSNLQKAAILQRINWFFQGVIKFSKGSPLPLYPGDWYWVPSRAIPGEAITEFPYFTFLYADLHAHLIALPMVLLAVAWGLSIISSRRCLFSDDKKGSIASYILSLAFGALVIGALKPTNTWDYYTYLILNIIICAYIGWKNVKPIPSLKIKPIFQRILLTILPILILGVLSKLLYVPFDRYFGQGYSQIGYYAGEKTPLGSYLVHWGLFLFLIFSYYAWETWHWMASTPMFALRKLKKYKNLIFSAFFILGIILIVLLTIKVVVALLIIPLGLWTLILILKPDQSDAHRLVLFMIGTALALTLFVEVTYLVGDIGRMNVVFKLYNQAWVLFALSTGLCAVWIFESLNKWHFKTQAFWQLIFILLVFGAALFPVMATRDKIADRMDTKAEQSLDGMAFMRTATYFDMGAEMNLSEDYDAILWMQDNIKGSPVILEGQAYEYRWGNRFTIYTGLPSVVGWNYHQRQQRAILQSNVVQERVDAIGQFYLTEDRNLIEKFLEQYKVSYIIMGQLERVFFPGAGLDKFEALDGILWSEVYRSGSTVIYEVKR